MHEEVWPGMPGHTSSCMLHYFFFLLFFLRDCLAILFLFFWLAPLLGDMRTLATAVTGSEMVCSCSSSLCLCCIADEIICFKGDTGARTGSGHGSRSFRPKSIST